MTNKKSLSAAEIRELNEAMDRAHRHVETKAFEEAATELRAVLKEAEAAGLVSSHLLWSLAVVSDYLGIPKDAVHYVKAGLAVDPLDRAIRNSMEIIARRIKGALLDPERPFDADPPYDTVGLYRLLLDLGRGDAECHLALARYELKTGGAGRALALAEAVLLLEPYVRDGWRVKVEALRALGRNEEAEATEREAGVGEAHPALPLVAPTLRERA